MFTYVNEIAVIGTTFFMVAVATLWYSDYLFEKPWRKAVGLTLEDIENAAPQAKRNLLITFASYLVAVFLIGVAVGYGSVSGIPVQQISVGLAIGFAALMVGFVVWEQRSVAYYFITVGFSTVFILGSTFLLAEWPW